MTNILTILILNQVMSLQRRMQVSSSRYPGGRVNRGLAAFTTSSMQVKLQKQYSDKLSDIAVYC